MPTLYPVVRTGFKKLNENDTWDMGVIRLKRAGFLQVKLIGETSLMPKDRRFWFALQNASKESFGNVRVVNGKAERSNPLAPGTYYLCVTEKNYFCGRHRFEIRAGQDTDLEVPFERGAPSVLEFVIKNKVDKLVAPPQGSIMVEIQDNSGRLILTRAASLVANNELLQKLEFAVRPGKYKVTATFTATDTSLRARGEAALTVGNKPAAAPQRIVLR